MTSKQRRIVEDANNTWNQQLMAACLAGNLEQTQHAVEHGADPIRARELTPFSYGCSLSPLVAVVLSLVQNTGEDNRPLGVDDVKNRLDLVQYLMEKGATLNDLVELPFSTLTLFGESGKDNNWSRDTKKADTEHAQQRPHGILSGGAERKKSLRLTGTEGKEAPRMSQGPLLSHSRKYGTVLHYLVSLKDHVNLFRLLHFTGSVPMSSSLVGNVNDVKSVSPSETPVPPKAGAILPFSLLSVLQQELEVRHTLDNEDDYTRLQTQSRTNSPPISSPSRPGSSSGRTYRQPLLKVTSMSSTMMRPHIPRFDIEDNAMVWNPFTMLLPHPTFPTLASRFGSLNMKLNEGYEEESEIFRSTSLLDFSIKITACDPFAGVQETTKPGKKKRTLNISNESSPSGQKVTTHDYDSFVSRTALELASAMCDTMATRLLAFYGADESSITDPSTTIPETDSAQTILVNGIQSELAWACATGNLARVETLLDAGGADGASLTQLSEDGRYTLIHYSVGQRQVLDYLIRRRGLKVDIENAFGESALVSLIRYGTGRNPPNAMKDDPFATDAVKLASLPPCVVRNYILMPFTLGSNVPQQPRLSTMSSAMTRGVAHSIAGARQGRNIPQTTASSQGNGVLHRGDQLRSIAGSSNIFQVISAEEMERTWSFTDRSTAELIQNLVDYGANIHGHIPESEYPLRYVEYAVEMEEKGRQSASNASAANLANMFPSKERDGAGGGASRQSQRNTAKSGGNNGGISASNSGKAVKNSPRSASKTFSPSRGSHRSKTCGSNQGADANFDPRASLSEDLPRHALNSHQQLIAFDEEGESAKGWRHASSNKLSDAATWTPTDNFEANNTVDSDSTATLVAARVPLRLTPLMYAILNYHPELIRKFVLEYKIDVMRRDSQGASALHYAAAWCPPGEASILELLLSPLIANTQAANNGAPIDVNAVDMAGRTPLYYAASTGNVSAMKCLLQPGFAVQAGKPDKHGLTPLHVAVLKNHPGAVEVLVRHSTKMLEALTEFASLPGAFGGKGRNEGSNGMLRSRRRTSLSQRHQQPGVSPSTPGLSFLAGHSKGGSAGSSASLPILNRLPSVTQLRSQHAASSFDPQSHANVEATDHVQSATPLEMAIKHECHPDIVRVLLYEASASISRPSGLPTGGSLLHLAVAQSKPIYVQMMLDCYADPDELDDEQCTPLFRALLSLKDVNFKEQSQMSGKPMMSTLSIGKEGSTLESLSKFETTLEIISLLLKYGTQPGMQSFVTLQTQFHIAAQLGLPVRVFRLLFGDFIKDNSSHANGVYSNPMTDLMRKGSDLPSVEWKYLGSEAMPNAFPPENYATASEAASAGVASTRRQQRSSRQNQQLDKFHDGVDGFFSAVTDMYGANPGSVDDIIMPVEHGMVRSAPSTTRVSGGKVGKISHFTDLPPTVNDALLITDSELRIPLHYLCAHVDRARQLSVLPTLLRILSLSPSDISLSGAEKDDSRNMSGVCRISDRQLSKVMCRMSDCEGRRPLHAACRAHFVEAVYALLEVDPESVFAVDAHGNTPLHDCVSGNCYGYLDSGIMHFSRDPSENCEEGGSEGGADDTRTAIAAVVEAVARAVRSNTPHTLEGFPTPQVPWAHEVLEKRDQRVWHRREASITNQVKEFVARSPFFNSPIPHIQSGSLTSEGTSEKGVSLGHQQGNRILISDWTAYMHLGDGQGRTALLLAGERGDVVAASALLRVSTVT